MHGSPAPWTPKEVKSCKEHKSYTDARDREAVVVKLCRQAKPAEHIGGEENPQDDHLLAH